MPQLTPPFNEDFLGPNGKPTPRWQAFLLKLQVDAQAAVFPVAQGGTGVATLPAHRLLLGDGSNPIVSAGAGSAGQTLVSNGASADPSFKSFAASQATPADPTGTTSTLGVMMGLAASLTPVVTGRMLVTVTGTILNASGIGDGANVQLRTGIGTAPANGDALTGTARGGLVKYVSSTTAGKVPFALSAIISGLTLSVAEWIDVSLAAVTGGTAAITDLSVAAMEC